MQGYNGTNGLNGINGTTGMHTVNLRKSFFEFAMHLLEYTVLGTLLKLWPSMLQNCPDLLVLLACFAY